MPIVSTIITTFNRSRYLRRAIESVLAQTFTDFELLVLDNSSSDNTEDVVKGFRDHRVRYIKHKPMNISQARNLGIKEAKGEYISFLDDDDEWLPCKLEKQLDVFKNVDERTSMVYGGFIRIDSEGREFNLHEPRLKGKILKDLLYQEAFTGSASNPMIRTSILKNMGGYNEDVTTGEDWELYLRVAEKYLIDYTYELLVKVRTHSGPRLGDKLKEQAELEMMVLDRYSYIFEDDKKLKSFYLQKIGGKFVRIGETDNGREYILQAIKANLLNYKAYIQYMLSVLGPNLYRDVHKIYKAIDS